MSRIKRKSALIPGKNKLPGWPELPPWPGSITRGEAFYQAERVFFRDLFTLKARTRDPLYLILMFIFGVLLFPLLIYIMVTMKFQHISDFSTLFSGLWLIFSLIITGAIAINFVLSMLTIFNILPSQKITKTITKQHIKKQPKRRKDFK